MIVTYASEPHYADHLRPIADAFGIPVDGRPPRGYAGPVVVASARDAAAAFARSPHCRLALLEHGAGQTYQDAPFDPSYAGGSRRFPSSQHSWYDAALILSPGPHAARQWRRNYPKTPVVELHGTPRLDPWVHPPGCNRDGMVERLATPEEVDDGCELGIAYNPCPTCAREGWTETEGWGAATAATGLCARGAVGVSFHWRSDVSPEAGCTWPFWREAVEELVRSDAGPTVVGHGHPRVWRQLAPWWNTLGVSFYASYEMIVRHCWLLVCDNSSVMYEWAGLGRPVLCLDSPAYRREVEHGLRFWSHPPGISVSDPARLEVRIEEALADGPAARALRFAACEEAYGVSEFDGRSTERAVAAIKEHLL